MMARPGGPRAPHPVLARTRGWHRRIGWLVAGWLATVALVAALGQSPSVPQLAALFVAVPMIVWYLLDHAGSNPVGRWPVERPYRSSSHRGQDFRVTHLASRLEAARTAPEARDALVEDLHGQLSTIIRERLHAKHGLVIEEEPAWSQGVMPPELWALLMHLPDPDLWRPERLAPILRRIEQW